MKYSKLVEIYDKINSTTKTLEKTDIIADFLKTVKPKEIKEIILLLRGRVFPEWDTREIGIGAQLAIKAMSSAYGVSKDKVIKEWRNIGDLGEVTEKLAKNRTQSTLFKEDVYTKKVLENLRKIAVLEGPGTVDRKISYLKELLHEPKSAKYIIRTCLEELRIGVGEGIVRDSISQAFNVSKETVQHAYDLTTDFGLVAEKSIKGEKELSKVSIIIGNPIKVMLAQRVADINEGFDRCGKPAQYEYKYDGFRMQIHKNNNKIIIFTRRLEDVTKQFPIIANAAKKAIKAKKAIVEGEAVGYDKKTGKGLPFQNISERIKRKYHIEKMAHEIPVVLNLFDIIYINGKNLISEDFKKRRDVLEKTIKEVSNRVLLSTKIVTSDDKVAKEFYDRSLGLGHEGVMIKNLKAPYKPGSRVGYMVKLKPIMESLDVVIVGAEWGTGKRAKWLSSFILACRDPKTEEYLPIGKMGTGVKEKEEEGVSFKELTKKLEPLIISQKDREVRVKPKIVLEIKYEEIQKSPTYKSGYALRFPRLSRLREDRSPEEIDIIERVKKLYEDQRGRK
ncbi:MAG: ATP-dependent DNA ligase [Candidatus Woesearchaeota archaeon]|nr:MAG: ATP-dependent DNA ligase [Candidatus Woesearchaeota archaeon]